ncbi:PB1 domain-containing protein [Artemisia annua]|uniref:PB1 domain-containing protein n=1 Tax=Artemisia annua TaxID=35608 RepID=A0A2U1N631_ARTAN|nr:PB1 domain-containing protein [Artemisia annua]
MICRFCSHKYKTNKYYYAALGRTLSLLWLSGYTISISWIPYLFRRSFQNATDRKKKDCILKVVCDSHKLPLAQTWAISPLSTLASHEQILEKKCGSFDTKCLGKVCMSTASLPYYVPDLGMWSFRKACREQHLDMYRGLVGRALLSRGSCFCEDVTKLGEEEYPLVHNAQMSGLTRCFSIFLHSVEGNHDYVLEFFLPLNIKDVRHVQVNLVQTLMQHIGAASGFELGENSHIEVVKPLMDLPANIEPDIISTTSYNFSNVATNSMNVPDECSSTNVSMEIISARFGDTGETSSPLKSDNKRKRGSDTMVLVKAMYENIIKEFQFVTSLGLLKLKNEVAKQFKLNGNMIRLKYWDEENELILICVDDDLKLALVTSEVNNSINLVCELSA